MARVGGICRLLVGGLLIPAVPAFAAPIEVVPGEYIVEFRESVAHPSQSAARAPTQAATTGASRRLGPRTSLITIPKTLGSSTTTGAARLGGAADPFCASLPKESVKSCSPNFIVRATKSSNDPLGQSLWGFGSDGIDAARGWEISTGSADVVVAVIDSGVDYTHPDLAQNMWRNPGEVPANGIDDDGNGYVDDVHGIDTIGETGDPQDQNGHGTHVAGTIGAVGDNGLGVVGVNWNTRIMALRFLDADGAGTIADAIEAMNYLIALREQGLNVRAVNASWGGGGFSEPFFNTLTRLNELGVAFVAAAGNESSDNDASPSYPSGYESPNVVAVGAITQDQNLADFSNFGAETVDIVAPGDGILSTVPGGGYAYLSGTSMATPHVAGALALLAAAVPSLTLSEAITRVFDTGVPLPAIQGLIRSGRTLNLGRLLRGESAPIPQVPLDELLCTYEVAGSAYGRDTAADTASVVQRGDELGFVEVALPFEFPLHRERFSTVTVSPNGVLYMGKGPGDYAYDFEPSGRAPRRSIAAFHTDLVAVGTKSGVRVATLPDRVTFRWVASLYGWTEESAAVTLTLFPDGTIRDSVEFSSPTAEIIAQLGTTIGLTGSVGESAVTFATGGDSIRDGLEVTFTPFCNGMAPGRTTNLKLSVANEPKAKSIVPGERFWVDITTDRPGAAVDVGLLVNGKSCSINPKRVGVASGTIRLQGSTRALERRYGVSRIGVFSGSVVREKRVVHPGGASARRAHRFSANSICRPILRSLRVIKR